MTDSLDTNIVLRYILNDIAEQKQQVIKLLNAKNTVHHLSTQTFLEIFYVLENAYEASREKAVDALSFFLTRYDDIVEYDHDLTRIAFPLYLKHPKLSWADCALAAEAEIRHHEPLMTFDKKLANQVTAAKLVE